MSLSPMVPVLDFASPQFSTTVPRTIVPVSPGAQCPAGYVNENGLCLPMTPQTPSILVPPVASPPVIPRPVTLPTSPTGPPTIIQTAQGPVAITIDPSTGQIASTIPAIGPLPPGQGFQQTELPDTTNYPYVYIGPQAGAPVSSVVQPTTGTDPVYPSWETTNPPGGSYQQSCENVQTDSAGNLWALCQRSDGTWVTTSLNYLGCQSAPYNQNGQLGCGGPGGTQLFTPATSSTPVPGTSVLSYGAYSNALYSSPLYNPYSTPYSNPAYAYQLPGGSYAPSVGSSSSSSVSNFFSQYKWEILLGLAAVIVLPRVLKSH